MQNNMSIYDPLTRTTQRTVGDRDTSAHEELEDIVDEAYGREHAKEVRKSNRAIDVYQAWYEDEFIGNGRFERFKKAYGRNVSGIEGYSSKSLEGSLAGYSQPMLENIDFDDLESAKIEVIGVPNNKKYSELIYIMGVKSLDQLFDLLTVHEYIHKAKGHLGYKSSLDIIEKEGGVWYEAMQVYQKEMEAAETSEEKAYYNDLLQVAERNYQNWEKAKEEYLTEKEEFNKRFIKSGEEPDEDPVEDTEEEQDSAEETEAEQAEATEQSEAA